VEEEGWVGDLLRFMWGGWWVQSYRSIDFMPGSFFLSMAKGVPHSRKTAAWMRKE
jgi:hypothetical protein